MRFRPPTRTVPFRGIDRFTNEVWYTTGINRYRSRAMAQRNNGITHRRKPIALLVSLIVIGILTLSPETLGARPPKGPVPFDRPIVGSVSLTGDTPGTANYQFVVSADTLALHLTLTSAPADLDLTVFSEEGTALATAASLRNDEELLLSQLSPPTLPVGRIIVSVNYQYSDAPIVNGEPLERIPFQLTAYRIPLEPIAVGTPGDTFSGTLSASGGMGDLYRIEADTDDRVLRLDIDQTIGDIDLLVSPDPSLLHPNATTYRGSTLSSAETLIIDDQSAPPYAGGTYYVLVYDQVENEHETSYRLSVSNTVDPPAHLLVPPSIPTPTTPLDHIITATVEIFDQDSGGSGVVVSPYGHILTNHHVIEGTVDNPERSLIVAITDDPAVPAEERFHAQLVAYDKERDMALLHITEGLYGSPLPEGFVFPHLPLRTDQPMELTEHITVAGYPSIGGTGSRVTITVASGEVIGLQRVPYGRLIKTNALISSGSSGGTAVDDQNRLIGLPTGVVEAQGAQVGFIHPIDAIPPEWLEIISTGTPYGPR